MYVKCLSEYIYYILALSSLKFILLSDPHNILPFLMHTPKFDEF